MKRLLLLFASIISLSVISAVAQERVDERKSMIDSMAVSILKRPSMQRHFTRHLKEVEKASVKDVIFVEYLTFRLTSDILYDSFSDMSDTDLRRVKSLMCSKFYEVLMNQDFWRNYARYLFAAYQLETGQSRDFSYKFNDARYNELAEAIGSRYHSFVENMEEVTELSLSLIKGLNESAVVRIKKAASYILLHALIDYFSYEELAAVDYSAFDLLDFIGKFRIEDAYRDSVEVARVSSEILGSSLLLDDVSRYVMSYRQAPASVHVKKHGHQEIKGNKFTYSGPVRDGVPHGKGGVLTDSKGITYTGTFKDGQRFGLFMVQKPGKDAVPQIWVKDKLQKNLPAEPVKAGMPKLPGMCEGRYCGYGVVYSDEKTVMQGFFLDGVLNGKGKKDSPYRTLEGEFVNGELTRGTIRWKTADWKIKEFSGVCSGDMLFGSMQYISNDGKYRKLMQGAFVDEYLEGRGLVRVRTEKYEMVRDGVFVKGIMFGEGKVVRTLKTTEEGVNEQQIYNGWLARGVPHGDGVVKISYSDMPDKVIRMSRYGVKIAPSGPGYVEIRME